jgi:aldose 1-epimerase
MDNPEAYVTTLNPPYLGCVVGRVANRITNGKFSLDGQDYQLAINNGPNCLHGGIKGFDKVFWSSQITNDNELTLTYTAADGEENFPGNLQCQVTYSIVQADNHSYGLKIAYHAVTDKPTIVNMTNHSYFNLEGHDSGVSVLETELYLKALEVTETDCNMTPNGRIVNVTGGALDFYSSKKLIGRDIALLPEFLNGGYDHNFLIKEFESPSLQ